MLLRNGIKVKLEYGNENRSRIGEKENESKTTKIV